MALSGAARERILATVVWLIDETLMRVGNEEYARSNDSYGATTLRNEHADVTGAEVTLSYRGKAGKEHQTSFRDRRVGSGRSSAAARSFPARASSRIWTTRATCGRSTRRRQRLPARDRGRLLHGQGLPHLRRHGALLPDALRCRTCRDESRGHDRQTGVIKLVAARLGNTPAVCRGSYLHPAVLDSYAEGTLTASKRIVATDGLQRQESQLLRFLEPLDALRDSEAVGASSSAGSG